MKTNILFMFKKLKNEKIIKIIFYLKLYIIRASQGKTKSLPEPTHTYFGILKTSQTYLKPVYFYPKPFSKWILGSLSSLYLSLFCRP